MFKAITSLHVCHAGCTFHFRPLDVGNLCPARPPPPPPNSPPPPPMFQSVDVGEGQAAEASCPDGQAITSILDPQYGVPGANSTTSYV